MTFRSSRLYDGPNRIRRRFALRRPLLALASCRRFVVIAGFCAALSLAHDAVAFSSDESAAGRNAKLNQSNASTSRLKDADTELLTSFENDTDNGAFDDALRQAMAAELVQSPFLNIVPDRKVNESLSTMDRPATKRVGREDSAELCARTSGSAVLSGKIYSARKQYVIQLIATTCSGTIIAQEEDDAADETNVLNALHVASRALRIKLGESPESVRKFDIPVASATSSLETLKNFGLGLSAQREMGDTAGIKYFERSIESDANFPSAYASLAQIFGNLREPSKRLKYAEKAYGLRSRASEREQRRISGIYFLATGELEKEIQNYKDWQTTYPRDSIPWNNLGNDYAFIGRLSEALKEYETALRLMPSAIGYTNVAGMQVNLSKFVEARASVNEAFAQKFDAGYLHQILYWIAFATNDQTLMQAQVAWSTGKAGDEDALLSMASDTEAYFGRLKRSRQLSNQAIQSAVKAGSKEAAALWQINSALREAEVGNFDIANEAVDSAIGLSTGRDVSLMAAFTAARTGDVRRATSLVEQVERDNPTDTLLRHYWLPTIHAAIELDNGEASRALDDLKITRDYELGVAGTFINYVYPAYIRGQAYLRMGDGIAAANEFQKLVNQPGLVLNFVTGSLAHLELARSYAMAGDTIKARVAYQQFFEIWNSSDADVTVLNQAQTENARIR